METVGDKQEIAEALNMEIVCSSEPLISICRKVHLATKTQKTNIDIFIVVTYSNLMRL